MSFSEKRRDFLKTAGLLGAGALVAGPMVSPAFAQKRKPKKVKDEIKIGHIAIFSGPFGTYGDLQERGSKLNDSKANPSESITQARQIVESEGCNFISGADLYHGRRQNKAFRQHG